VLGEKKKKKKKIKKPTGRTKKKNKKNMIVKKIKRASTIQTWIVLTMYAFIVAYVIRKLFNFLKP